MSFRTVVVKTRCKLEYSLNYLVYRTADSEKKICLNEISTLIVQNTGVAITAALLSMLMEKKIKVIFCDAKSNPQGEMIPYYGAYNNYEKIKSQINWDGDSKDAVWKLIIIKKIEGQRNNLSLIEKQDSAEKLSEYLLDVLPGDPTNREGHSAKVYFNSCFGKDFSRGDECDTNAFLNYGYSIILSAINRELKALGYLTEFGIHHIGESNPFNLSCDLMEPLRPLIDRYVLKKKVDRENFKGEFINLLNETVSFDGKNMILDNAIHLYVLSVISALNEKKPGRIKFINYDAL